MNQEPRVHSLSESDNRKTPSRSKAYFISGSKEAFSQVGVQESYGRPLFREN